MTLDDVLALSAPDTAILASCFVLLNASFGVFTAQQNLLTLAVGLMKIIRQNPFEFEIESPYRKNLMKANVKYEEMGHSFYYSSTLCAEYREIQRAHK
jgi:hypothetical protein